MMPTLEIQVEKKDRQAILTISGEVDLYSSPRVRKSLIKLTNQKIPNVIVDLSGVSYMDSSGVATLVEALQIIERYRGKLLLCGLNTMVREVFELSRLDTVFSIHENVESLIRQFA